MSRIICLILSVFLTSLNPLICFADASPAIIEEGTPVKLKLVDAVSTDTACAGQQIAFSVLEDVTAKDGKTVVIKENAPGTGYLTNVDQKDGGKGGRLSIDISSTKAIDGTKIPLRGSQAKSGSDGAGLGNYAIGYVFGGLLGVGIVALCKKSKHAQMPAGTIVTAFVSHDTSVPIAPTIPTAVAVGTVTGNVISADKAKSEAANTSGTDQEKDTSASNTPVATCIVSNDSSHDAKDQTAINIDKIPADAVTYMAYVEKTLKRHWHPPHGQDSRSVKVLFNVHKDGSVSDLQLDVANSSPRIDEYSAAAIDAVNTSKPLKEPPEDYMQSAKRDCLNIAFTFDYKVHQHGQAVSSLSASQ